ncbi:MAG: Trk system potassium transporter TrkA [Clostridia bacterium]|nr:Trk system potassium transporter TrkA [Clostridia bacterium]
MKIIIAGIGKVGERLCAQLSAEDHEITVIDQNAAKLETAISRYDVMGLLGNCAMLSVLKEAGIKEADVLIVTTAADEVNLLCCTTAHYLNPSIHTIVRIRNPEYSEQIYEMKNSFSLSFAVNPELQTAEEIDRLLKYPGFLRREVFAKSRVEIVEWKIPDSSILCGLSLNELSAAIRCQILVCAVARNGKTFIPDGHFVLQAGDFIFVTGLPHELTALLKSLGIIARKVKRVLLCGGGTVSFYLARKLEKSGIFTKIIEQSKDRCLTLSERLPDVEIVCGDASYQPLLESEGLRDYDALVTLTGIDEMNMIISLYGKDVGVPQVITKVGHTDNSHLLDSLSLGSVISPKELCTTSIVRYIRAMQNGEGAAITIHSIANGQAEALEFKVDEQTLHCGQPLKQLSIRSNVLIACITHGRDTAIPGGNSSFVEGDTVVVVTDGNRNIRQLNDIFEK